MKISTFFRKVKNFLKCQHLQICEPNWETQIFCRNMCNFEESQTFFVNKNWNKIENENIYWNYEQFFENRVKNYNSPNVVETIFKITNIFGIFRPKFEIRNKIFKFETGTHFEYGNKFWVRRIKIWNENKFWVREQILSMWNKKLKRE